MRADADGLPRWTVMVGGITTRSSTSGAAGHSTTGLAPEPPCPANSGCSGITTGTSGTSRPASVSAIIPAAQGHLPRERFALPGCAQCATRSECLTRHTAYGRWVVFCSSSDKRQAGVWMVTSSALPWESVWRTAAKPSPVMAILTSFYRDLRAAKAWMRRIPVVIAKAPFPMKLDVSSTPVYSAR